VFRSKEKGQKRLADTVSEALGHPDWLESVTVNDDGDAFIVIAANPENPSASEPRRIEAEGKAAFVPGIRNVRAILTAERGPAPAAPTPAPSVKLEPSPRRVTKGARLSDEAIQQSSPDTSEIKPIPGIARILVVASAKGGVGKSTVAVNLAAAMAKAGMNVGLMDADIYGPSIPTMLGVEDADPKANAHGKLEPIVAHGLKTLSIGYLTDTDAPMIWRGPMVMSAITQMLNDASWGTRENPLDLLIIDTPPGTGDAQLTLAQKVPVTAAIIVTTPQEVALADVRRGAAMFAKTAVPILGIVETMSWFEAPDGSRIPIMGEGGGKRTADALGLPLMAQIPMLQSIREGGDTGHPVSTIGGPAAHHFLQLAKTTAEALDTLQTKPAPEIIFED
jgi:ATP-binding protein involved in chromosome partitioning